MTLDITYSPAVKLNSLSIDKANALIDKIIAIMPAGKLCNYTISHCVDNTEKAFYLSTWIIELIADKQYCNKLRAILTIDILDDKDNSGLLNKFLQKFDKG